MDSYQEYIHISRYSRFRDDLGRRETWTETVQRYVDFFDKRTKHQFSDELQGPVRDSILQMKAMPSMRALMTAGPALERENLAAFNCFVADTKFMTRGGLRTFAETAGTTQEVLAGDGMWRPAEIRSFGQQSLQTVTFRPGSRSRTSLRHAVTVTPDHRWITTNRGEVTDLRVGDTVAFNYPEEPEFDSAAFVAGFGFGDGTLDTRGNARIRLCGKKAQYLPVFESAGPCSVSYPPSQDSDPIVCYRGKAFSDWKHLPEEPSYWWLQGYFAADGHNNPIQPGISTQDVAAAKYLLDNSAYGGIAITGWNEMNNATNYGERAAPLIRLGARENIEFRVMSIDASDGAEVFCATEPVTGQFTLAHGILTGNCSYLACNTKRSFSEALYILMCGTGVGFSCERQEIAKLPAVPSALQPSDSTIVVADSKEGWAKSFQALLSNLWNGDIPKVDYSKVRASGERLKTFGGRASGPDPLRKLFEFSVDLFKKAAGRKLTSIEVHDMMCMIGEIVVVGGVRRSALISLSNLSDQRMRDAKSGQWWSTAPHRALANNSVSYTEKPDASVFMEEWLSLVKSGSGERGIFNRKAAQKQAAKWGRRSADHEYGCNPCSEIILRDKQLCNLTEVIARADDTFETLREKVRVAAILGTLQASLTDFKFVSESWHRNTADEALLGVSITGIMDNLLLAGKQGKETLKTVLNELRDYAREVNAEWAEKLGIKPSAAITCVKPSGTVSQLCNTASGIHARHNRNYIRTVRIDKKDPLYSFMLDKGFYIEDDAMRPDSTAVVSFPMTAPTNAITREEVPSIEALDLWLLYQREWCEHKPSVTVSVKDEDWLKVGAWVYEHFDEVSGVSFLPHTDHTYQQAPYQDMTEQQMADWTAKHPQPEIDWAELAQYEKTDNTVGAQTLACVAGVCELPGT